MKILISILVLALIVGPAMAVLTEDQASWVNGVEDGYKLGSLAWQARGNETAASLYNQLVDQINGGMRLTMNQTDYEVNELAHIKPIVAQADLPPVLQGDISKWVIQ